MVTEFNETYNKDSIHTEAIVPEEPKQALWGNLIVEELSELALGFERDSTVEVFDAVCDIIYVAAQQAQLYGYPIQKGLEEVHRSNMSKLGVDGEVLRRDDGKVLKGPNFEEPNLEKVLEDSGS